MERLFDQYDEIMALDVPALLESCPEIKAPQVVECLNATRERIASFDFDFESEEVEEARLRVRIWDFKQEMERVILPAKRGLGAGQTSPEINAALAAVEKMRPDLVEMERQHAELAANLAKTREIKDKLDADMRLLMERMASDRMKAISIDKNSIETAIGTEGWNTMFG